MGMLEDLYKDDEDMQALVGILGSSILAGTVKVKIVGLDGREVKSFELEKNESKNITLEEKQTLKVSGGTCALKEAAEMNAPAYGAVNMDWGQSKESIIKEIGPADREDDINGHPFLGYDDIEISKYTDSSLAYCFEDDQCYAKLYTLDDVGLNDFKYLQEALTEKYGASVDNLDDLVSLMTFFTGDEYPKATYRQAINLGYIQFASWGNEDGNTIIVLLWLGNENNQMLLYYGQQWDQIPKGGKNLNGL